MVIMFLIGKMVNNYYNQFISIINSYWGLLWHTRKKLLKKYWMI